MGKRLGQGLGVMEGVSGMSRFWVVEGVGEVGEGVRGLGMGCLACHAFGLGKGLGKGLGGLGKWFSGMSRCRNMKETEYNDYGFAAAWG